MDEKNLTEIQETKDIGNTEPVNENVLVQYALTKGVANKKSDMDDKKQLREKMKQVSKECDDFLQSLCVNNTLTAMVAAQMDHVHELLQDHFILAKRITPSEQAQYHVNTVAKLSNVFIQQATLMQKLQGKGQQKVTVEHVHVHNGGQAIVGNVMGRGEEDEAKENRK